MATNEDLLNVIFTSATLMLELFDDDDNDNDENSYDNDLEDCVMYFDRSLKRKSTLRLENYVERVIPSYNDDQFKSHFRMRKSTYSYILNCIRPALIRNRSGNETITPEKQLLIAIWKMATPDSYRSICEKFNVGRATALRAVRKVIKALVSLSPRFITWPEGDRVEEIYMEFAKVSAFPRVLGAIDGTHINIKAPHVNHKCYINRKGHHSIQLQAICDHERRFIHCLAGHVGSVHDQRVFRLSEVHEYLEDADKFPNDTHLVGDAAYSIHNHLMVPFRDNGHLTEKQKNYNFCLGSARITIERSFALLKGRFRSLLTVLDMSRVDLISDFIMACCVLHNVCLLQNDEFPDAESDISDSNNIPVVNQRRVRNAGHYKRDIICNNLLMRNV